MTTVTNEQNTRMLERITCIAQAVDKDENKLRRLQKRVANHAARLTSQLWLHKVKGTAPDAKSLQLATSRIAYDAGVTSEALFRELCSLDDIHGDDAVKAARKTQVLRVKSLMDVADKLRKRAQEGFHCFHEKLTALAAHGTPQLEPEQPKQKPLAQSVTVQDMEEDVQLVEGAPDDEEEDVHLVGASDEEEEEEEESPEPEYPISGSWDLHFEQQRASNGIVLVADVGGLLRSSLQVVANKKERTITINGIKREARRGQPTYKKLNKIFSVSKKFDVSAMAYELRGSVLIVTVPHRVIPIARRCPSPHPCVDAYNHAPYPPQSPYYPHYPQDQYRPQSRRSFGGPRFASPFFGW